MTDKAAPMMTIQEFSKRVGVSAYVVEGWVRRGYIPTIKIGKRCLVNVAAIEKKLIAKDNILLGNFV